MAALCDLWTTRRIPTLSIVVIFRSTDSIGVMSMTLVKIVSLVFQVLLMGLDTFAPPVRPEKIQKALSYAIGAATLLCTSIGISLYPGELPAGPGEITGILLVLASIPPVLGALESKLRKNGQAVYSTGRVPGEPNRFPGHMSTNILGALATSGLIWTARSTSGFDSFVVRFSNDAAFNIMLPLATIVIFAFVRWQQLLACPDVDHNSALDPAWEDGIAGSSLRHWHQVTNVIYLVVATFTATTTILYLFAHAMMRAKTGHPLPISWQAIVTIVISLSFLYACGGPWSRKFRAVYLTFLTGTPAALAAAIVWLSLFEGSQTRNIAALSTAGIGYGMYCIEVVLGVRGRGEKVQLHYFSAAVIAIVLVTLLIALYLS